ncbi:MAG: ThuA domain-containing protein [Opitutaceae bacterium]
MRKTSSLFLAVLLTLTASFSPAAEKPKPIKALLVTGGGFHDYTAQKKTLSEGLAARLNIELTVLQEGTAREHKHSVYENPDWAKGYDVIVHNECFGMVDDKEFVERVAAPHKAGVPAVILHASVHSYRNAPTDEWRQVMGQKSMSHEGRRDLLVKSLDPKHPVMRGFPAEWPNPQDELYKIEKTWENVTPLAKAYGQETKQDHVVVWLSTYGKGRAFVTTLGHLDETMKTDVFLDLVARGLLWSLGKLKDDGTPAAGYGPGGK